MALLVEPDTALLQRSALRAANCCSIPIAARKKRRPVFLDGMHQYQIASAVQLYDEDGVPAEGLPYGARRTVDKAPNLVEVSR